ncbi:MAG: glycosyltransferase family 4 protein [Thermodesulfovibrionia bacterium]
MRVAIVHEWLVNYAGSERVLAEIIRLYPHADIFSIIDFLSDGERGFLLNRDVKTSFIQYLPMAKDGYRAYLTLMPFAIKQFNLSGYDVIISSSHALAKGVRKTVGQLHICYCHTPMRYIWDLQSQYLRETGLDRGIRGIMVRALLNHLRRWDIATSEGVNYFISNSHYIRDRIKRAYARDAVVIYPPVDTEGFCPADKRDEYFLTVSRMVPYKKVDIIVEAFARMGLPLIVVGDGPELKRIRRLAKRNIEFLGYLKNDVLRTYMQRARAFVYAAEEDFGIAPVEAQACGIPVIAFGRGGVTETVIPFQGVMGKGQGAERSEIKTPTGIFFYEQTPEALINAVKEFMKIEDRFNPHEIRRNAEGFSRDRFRKEFKVFIDERIKEFFNQ